MYEEIFEKFKEKNPHVSLEVMIIPFGEYQQKMSMYMASSSAPDISWLSDTMIPQFLTSDQLHDLSAIKDDAGYDFEDIVPSTFKPVSKDNKICGVAFSSPPFVYYYNKDLFKAKGLKTPIEYVKENNWTYDTMLDLAKAIKDPDNGVYGLNIIANSNWKNTWLRTTHAFAWGFGANVFSDDGKQFLFNTPEAENTLQFLGDLIFKEKVHPMPGDQVTFESGKLGMYYDTLSYMGTAKKITDFEWDIAPSPKGPADGPTLMGYAAYTMIKSGNMKPEALELLKEFTNKESMSITAQYFVPCRKSILNGENFKSSYPLPAESVELAIIEPMKNGKPFTAHPKMNEIDTEMNTIIDYFYTGRADVKEIIQLINDNVIPITK
jgi:multiple sugar transport system substrate-binding protein